MLEIYLPNKSLHKTFAPFYLPLNDVRDGMKKIAPAKLNLTNCFKYPYIKFILPGMVETFGSDLLKAKFMFNFAWLLAKSKCKGKAKSI